jgi:hypothetical protein
VLNGLKLSAELSLQLLGASLQLLVEADPLSHIPQEHLRGALAVVLDRRGVDLNHPHEAIGRPQGQ